MEISFIFSHLQSQFRFDNECYLNLPDNHKRVSLTPRASFDLNAVDVTSMITDDNDDDSGSNVVARTPAAISANESNFNLVYDDFNLASVSMPVFTSFFYLLIFTVSFKLFMFVPCLKSFFIASMCFLYEFPPFPNHFSLSKKVNFVCLPCFQFPFFAVCNSTFFFLILNSCKFCLHYEVLQVYFALHFETTFDFRFFNIKFVQ